MHSVPCLHCKVEIPRINCQQGGCHLDCYEEYHKEQEEKGYLLIMNVITRARTGMPYKEELKQLTNLCKRVPSVKQLLEEIANNLENR